MEEYIIKSGDTLEDISSMYNVPVQRIIDINNLEEPYILRVGDVLILPITNNNDIFDYYTVKSGDTVYSIASKYNMDIDTLSKINGLNRNEYIYPNQVLMVPKANIKTYITNLGDSINSVANDLGVSPEDLILDNNNIYLLEEQLIISRR